MDIGLAGEKRINNALAELQAARRALREALAVLEKSTEKGEDSRQTNQEEVASLRMANQDLRRQMNDLQRKHDQEIEDLKKSRDDLRRRVAQSLRQGIGDIYKVIGVRNPADEAQEVKEELLRLKDSKGRLEHHVLDLEATVRQLEGQNRDNQGKVAHLKLELEETQLEARGCEARGQRKLVAGIVNQVGRNDMAMLLLDIGKLQSESVDSRKLLGRVIKRLNDDGLVVMNTHHERFTLESDRDLARYELPDGERFRKGPVEVVLPGFIFANDVLIKSKIAYLEEQNASKEQSESDQRAAQRRAESNESSAYRVESASEAPAAVTEGRSSATSEHDFGGDSSSASKATEGVTTDGGPIA